MKTFKEYLEEKRLISSTLAGMMAVGSPAVNTGKTVGSEFKSTVTAGKANLQRYTSDTTRTGTTKILGTGIQNHMTPVRTVVSSGERFSSPSASSTYETGTRTVGTRPPVSFTDSTESGKTKNSTSTTEPVKISASVGIEPVKTPFTTVNLTGKSQVGLDTSRILRNIRRRP